MNIPSGSKAVIVIFGSATFMMFLLFCIQQGNRMKNSAIAPDLLMDSYPLDNDAANDLIGNHRPRAESALFDQFISRLPHNSDHSSPSFISSHIRRTGDSQTWREVNGDWRHPRNTTNLNDLTNRNEALWVDNDQMNVPLLNSNMVG